MHIITQKKIKLAAEKFIESREALLAWLKLMRRSTLANFAEMKNLVNSVNKVGNKHIFNIGGNKIRLVAEVDYKFRKIFIREILSHGEYDKRSFL